MVVDQYSFILEWPFIAEKKISFADLSRVLSPGILTWGFRSTPISKPYLDHNKVLLVTMLGPYAKVGVPRSNHEHRQPIRSRRCLTREERLMKEHLAQDTASRPHVHRGVSEEMRTPCRSGHDHSMSSWAKKEEPGCNNLLRQRKHVCMIAPGSCCLTVNAIYKSL